MCPNLGVRLFTNIDITSIKVSHYGAAPMDLTDDGGELAAHLQTQVWRQPSGSGQKQLQGNSLLTEHGECHLWVRGKEIFHHSRVTCTPKDERSVKI